MDESIRALENLEVTSVNQQLVAMTNIFDECSLPQFLNNCFYSIFLFYTVHISKRFLEEEDVLK